MTKHPLRAISYVFLTCCLAIAAGLAGSENPPVFSGLTAHEWGTFTSIAGGQRQARNGRRWRARRICQDSSSTFAVRDSSGGFAGRFGWRRRSSIFTTRAKSRFR